MYIFAMFDHVNQSRVVEQLSDGTKKELRDRMIDGDNDEGYLALVGL